MEDLPPSEQAGTTPNIKKNPRKQNATRGLLKQLFPFSREKNDASARREIEELIEEAEISEEDSIDEHERTLISNVLNLRDLPVIDVMIPRADINAVDIQTSPKELFQLLTEKPHSRLPVYDTDSDNIVGAVHMKDIVANFARKKDHFKLRDIIRNVLIVSPAMRVLDLLLQMRQSKVHLALVVDEFGGIDGLISINDLIEVIVGEIDDEHALDIQPQVIERPDGTILADARFNLEDFEERFHHEWTPEEKEDNDTLGGLINTIAGHVPSRGEIIKHTSGMEFEILDSTPRRINRLRIRHLTRTSQPQ